METLLRAGLSNAVAATVMAIVVALPVAPLARRPAILHGLWLLVLIKLVTPPVLRGADPLAVAASPEATAGLAEGRRHRHPNRQRFCPYSTSARMISSSCPPPTRPSAVSVGHRCAGVAWALTLDWRSLAGIWLAGIARCCLSSRPVAIRRFQRLLSEARCGSEMEQANGLTSWAARHGTSRGAGPLVGPGPRLADDLVRRRPRPRLIVPPRVSGKRLDGRQRSTLIVHELAHLRRGDHLVRLLETGR